MRCGDSNISKACPLSWPVVANSDLSSYVRDLDFATVAAALMFSDDEAASTE